MIQLIGLKREAVRVIHADSVPKGFRTMAMWNPPMLSASALIAWHENLPPGAARRRVSSLEEASRLLAHLINHGLRSIAFVRTRALAERLYEATYERLGAAERAGFAVYRAGYSKEKRRQIEQALFGDKLTAVVATNALELGVDIGSLDVTIHLGYPGTTASLAQQAGRAGRGGRDALAIMIARDNPLEQHLMRAPRAVLEVVLPAPCAFHDVRPITAFDSRTCSYVTMRSVLWSRQCSTHTILSFSASTWLRQHGRFRSMRLSVIVVT